MAHPTCTVLLATFNRRPTLLRCLDHLGVQDVGASQLQVIVIDDGSTDGTRDALDGYVHSFADLVVLSQENRGPSIARDRGLEFAEAPITLFINDDTILEPWTVRTHLEEHARHPMSMVLGTFDFVPEYASLPLSRMLTETPWLFSYPLMRDGDTLRADLAATCNMSTPTEAAKRVGFDHRFFIYAEDVDFALGLEAEGHTLRFCERATGWHDHHLTVESIQRATITRGLGAAKLALKWGRYEKLLPHVRATVAEEARARALHDQAAATLQDAVAGADGDAPLPEAAYVALARLFTVGNMLGYIGEPTLVRVAHDDATALASA